MSRQPAPTEVVDEYPTRFEADIAAACLTDHGIENFVRADPAHAVAPHLVTMRGFQLEVHQDDLDLARTALGLDGPVDLEAEELDRAYFHIRFRDRPRWVRWLAIIAIVCVAGPTVVVAVTLILTVLSQLAPS